MDIIREDDRMRLCLHGDMTISYAAAIRDELVAALGQSDFLEVDMHEVVEVDLAGLQLLCAAHRTALVQGKVFTISDDKVAALDKARAAAGFVFHRSCGRCPDSECLWVGGME